MRKLVGYLLLFITMILLSVAMFLPIFFVVDSLINADFSFSKFIISEATIFFAIMLIFWYGEDCIREVTH